MKFFFDEDGDFRFGGRALYLLLHTSWLRYFRKNGRRCWKWTRDSGWMEIRKSGQVLHSLRARQCGHDVSGDGYRERIWKTSSLAVRGHSTGFSKTDA